MIALFAFLPGIWLAFLNWHIFWRRHIKKENEPSWIPLLSGCLIVGAILIAPIDSVAWWVPFFFEWGSIPGISYSIWWNIKYKNMG